MLTESAFPASMTAFHFAFAYLRRHRAAPTSITNPFVLPSFAFIATPWLWSSPIGLLSAGMAHVLWFVACEILSPPISKKPAIKRPPVGSTTATLTRAVVTAAPAARTGFISTPVVAVLDETSDIKTFRLARPDGFEFSAGQFLAVRVSVGGKPHVRCYSISSSPDARGYLEISVRRQGLVSTTLHATVRTGSTLAINRPAGQFVYPSGDDRPLALLAGGIGITPLLAMLRHALSAEPTRPISLLYSVRDRGAIAFLNELRVIAERFPQVRLGVTLSSDPSAPAPWRAGHIDLAMLRQYVAHPSHTIFCICGPTPMMASMEQLLRAEGVPPDQVRSEQFATAAAAASLNEATTAAHAPIPDRSTTSGRRLTLATSRRETSVATSQTLLDAIESEGVDIPSSCRSGVCQACRTRLLHGEADCRSSVLDPEDRAAGFILPCVTYALGDCVVEV